MSGAWGTEYTAHNSPKDNIGKTWLLLREVLFDKQMCVSPQTNSNLFTEWNNLSSHRKRGFGMGTNSS